MIGYYGSSLISGFYWKIFFFNICYLLVKIFYIIDLLVVNVFDELLEVEYSCYLFEE